MNKFKVTQLV